MTEPPVSQSTPSPEPVKNLTCDQQAGPAQPSNSGLRIGDVIFDGLAKPQLQNSALRLSTNGTNYFLYKAFVYVIGTPHSHATIKIQQPETARLYYTDPDTWGNQRSPSAILHDTTRTVIVEACGDLTGYTGGVLVQSPSCVQLLVWSDDQARGSRQGVVNKAEIVGVGLGVASC